MAMEGARKKEKPMSGELPLGAQKMNDARERGDYEAVRRMQEAAVRTRLANAEKQRKADELAREMEAIESDRMRDKRTLAEIRTLEAQGVIELDPKTGEVIPLYEPPTED